MKRKIAIAILGILLMGIVSASFVNYLSNTITGKIEVKGPVFYLDGTNPIGISSIWGLKLNNDSVIEQTSTFTGSNNKYFVSEKLGVESFYAANYKIVIEAKSNNESGQIDAELYYIEGDNPYNKMRQICSGSVTSVYDKGIYEINCYAGELNNLDPDWRIALRLSDGLNDILYTIYMDGDSKIEISKA